MPGVVPCNLQILGIYGKSPVNTLCGWAGANEGNLARPLPYLDRIGVAKAGGFRPSFVICRDRHHFGFDDPLAGIE